VQSAANRTQFQATNRYQNNLIFYIKLPSAAATTDQNNLTATVKNQLLKFEINLKEVSTYSSIHDQVESIFNQFIDNLKLPIDKFHTNNKSNANTIDLSTFKSSNHNYKVTYNNKTGFNFDHDDDYVDFEEFERWTMENAEKQKIPKLKYLYD